MILERWTKVWNVTSESDEIYFFTKVTGLYFTIFSTMIFGFFLLLLIRGFVLIGGNKVTIGEILGGLLPSS